jgi:hypothetical protein
LKPNNEENVIIVEVPEHISSGVAIFKKQLKQVFLLA